MSSNTQTNESSKMKSKPTTQDAPGLDEIHDTLSEKRRRYALCVLVNHEPIGKKELARRVAAIQYEKPLSKVSSDETKRIVVALHQQHLPHLSKHGFVSWDTQNNIVSLGPYAPLVLEYLDIDEQKRSLLDRLSNGVF